MILEIPIKFTEKFGKVRKSTIKNMVITLQGIFHAKSVNLAEVKDELPRLLENKTNSESNYKRLIRFFQIPDEEKKILIPQLLQIGIELISKIDKNINHYYLIPSTREKNGKEWIHLLSLCLVVNGVSIPLFWEDLKKRGHSSQDERKKYFNKILQLYNLSNKCILADREYVGQDFFDYLTNKKIRFVIRLKKKTYRDIVNDNCHQVKTKESKQQNLRYSKMERLARLPKYAQTGVSKFIEINNKKYLFIIKKNETWKIGDNANEELIYLITSLNRKRKAIKAYKFRWSIECCFKHLKTKGFDLEDVNVKGELKVMLMVALVSFLYTLCVLQGLIQRVKIKKGDWKKYKTEQGDKFYLAKSFFKKGREILMVTIKSLKDFVTFIYKLLHYDFIPFCGFVQ